jgi:hypothetical protein
VLTIRKIIYSDEGVVGIIVAILLIGLILAVIGIVQSVYVPQWLEQKEADHMHVVSYQFTQLKHSLDILSVVEQKNVISTYITLGIADIPIFGSGRTYDSLEILSDKCGVEISNETDSCSFPLDIIKYSSGNSYFVDQSYIYEAGALILSQSKANILNGQPFLSVSNYTNVSLTIVNISSVEGKRFAGGYGTYSVYMEFLKSDTYIIDNFKKINIITNYQNAWHLFFNSTTLRYSGLSYKIKDIEDGITIDFSGSLGNLVLKVVDISAQIAPGWIE